ncbi:hypothetical protein [Halobacteriovorax sp. CON-3]|uniref:hypothetical protein n=1 Tax=Halobacteriovorax sp. CON-3 TaxID=3157710 RepID=UPI003721E114
MMRINDHIEEIVVDFDSLYLDINNPRFGSKKKKGYEDNRVLFDLGEQGKTLELLNKNKFLKQDLKNSILSLGWYPDSKPIVWKHPKEKGKYVVLEGNCRIGTLKKIREEFTRMNDESDAFENYKSVISDTSKIEVKLLKEDDIVEMAKKMAHILSVRHISGAVAWSPHARNVYIVESYFSHGGDRNKIDMDTVRVVASLFGVSTRSARSSIQNALIFEDFKSRYSHMLKDGTKFDVRDQQFIEQISSSVFLRDRFSLDKLDVKFDDDAALMLFNGSFLKGRGDEERELNIFPTAKSWVVWKKLVDYDAKPTTSTSFATDINLLEPEESRRIFDIEQDMIAHKNGVMPTEIIDKLIEELGRIDLDTMITKSDHLKSSLKTLSERIKNLSAKISK